MRDDGPRKTMLGPGREDATGDDYTDAWGRRWVAVGQISADEVDVARTEERRDAASRAEPEPDVRSLSVDELAEKLRPRRLVGDFEYRLHRPDYEVAEQILAMDTPPSTNGCRAPEARFVVGTDDRVRLTDPRFWPGSPNAYLTQTCTATMIGPSTALCAAHCFYQNGWIATRSITFGANTDAPTAPFGSLNADSLTLPGAWNSAEWDWDFAVLEFSPSRPDLGRQTGWHGTAQNSAGRHAIVGYPADKPVPSSWIKSGTYTRAVGSRYEHDIDIFSGDSGAGAYNTGDDRCDGIQSTQWFTTTPQRTWNEVRRWDATTYNFFHAYGNWPRA